jgi:hypothetical protein
MLQTPHHETARSGITGRLKASDFSAPLNSTGGAVFLNRRSRVRVLRDHCLPEQRPRASLVERADIVKNVVATPQSEARSPSPFIAGRFKAAWWQAAGIDAVMIAQRLWQHTRLDGAPIQ